jgi:parallel beta-helix repeat protein
MFSILMMTFCIQSVKAWAGTVYIRADGSIYPSAAPIMRDGSLYTLTSDISSTPDGILIERDNMTLEGAGYSVRGNGKGKGISLYGRSNVTIRNIEVESFYYCIFLNKSSNNLIAGNSVVASYNQGISLNWSSNYNSILGNSITASRHHGLVLNGSSSSNSISENIIAANMWYGINLLWSSSNNSIVENNITDNRAGIAFIESSNNFICHNNFVNNTRQVFDGSWVYPISLSTNVWDNGFPSGGNYWSNYTDVDNNGDGIGDIPYIVYENNQDNYPLMTPHVIPEFPSFLLIPVFMVATLLTVIGFKRKQSRRH